ncbi:phosphoglycerate dehydrogenase-like enzyme [Bradyrhizobium sp. USDA 4472]
MARFRRVAPVGAVTSRHGWTLMMRLRCAILDDYFKLALDVADWSKLSDRIDTTVFGHPLNSEQAAASALADFDIICAMRERTAFPRSLFDKLPKLKLLLTSGMRNAAIDMEAAKGRGVAVAGTQYSRDPTAPLAMGLILELTRGIGRENARMHAGEPWQTFAGVEIEGLTLGVLGLGKLGTKMAGIAKAFGMNVIAWSPNLTPEKCAAAGVGYATKEELFAKADIITIHVVLSDRSRGLVSRADLARMKPTAFLVNTARGPIVDEQALLEALQQRKIAGAGIDVFSVEPLPVDHPFRKLDNLVLTPHLGYATEDGLRIHYGQMVEAIDAFTRGSEPPRKLA